MSDRRTVLIVCAKAPRRVGCVPAVRERCWNRKRGWGVEWFCSFCGARVRVVA